MFILIKILNNFKPCFNFHAPLCPIDVIDNLADYEEDDLIADKDEAGQKWLLRHVTMRQCVPVCSVLSVYRVSSGCEECHDVTEEDQDDSGDTTEVWTHSLLSRYTNIMTMLVVLLGYAWTQPQVKSFRIFCLQFLTVPFMFYNLVTVMNLDLLMTWCVTDLCHYPDVFHGPPGVLVSGPTDVWCLLCCTWSSALELDLDLVIGLDMELESYYGYLWFITLSSLAKKCTQPQECNKQVSIIPKLINCWSTTLTQTLFMDPPVDVIIGCSFYSVYFIIHGFECSTEHVLPASVKASWLRKCFVSMHSSWSSETTLKTEKLSRMKIVIPRPRTMLILLPLLGRVCGNII